ncbi:hypothetical protein CSC2_16500 [Clostridium zeae]|uniref:AraC-type arabinose-binding/dimerisation domain-containing protein n=1 Tax=Clostridium zeae TaxID=2759022 RepID=A0ABQ1E8U9_9CLOT|nr:hypothetical protein CSC2_16500 [Clostridium zeae]
MYVVAGRLDVFINSVKYELTKDDLMVINLNEVHSTQNLSMNNVILVQIPYELLKEYYEEIDNLSFNCNSTLVNVDEAVFAKIKYMLRSMDDVYNKQELGYKFKFDLTSQYLSRYL